MVSPRRIRWTMRAAVYGPLALLAVLVIGMRPAAAPSAPPPPPLHDLVGTTSQGARFELRLNADGSIARAATTLHLTCAGGGSGAMTMDWVVSDDDRAQLRRDGDRLTIRSTWQNWSPTLVDHATVVIDGTAAGTGRAGGTFRATRSWGPPDGPWTTCTARDVDWRAAR